ncbi:hypothetical protein TYRP_011983 [Tyrophagus putrescentiae]|nr:hypothetical protein TYRP_011983 [Tyrophagus putrescentiae]
MKKVSVIRFLVVVEVSAIAMRNISDNFAIDGNHNNLSPDNDDAIGQLDATNNKRGKSSSAKEKLFSACISKPLIQLSSFNKKK